MSATGPPARAMSTRPSSSSDSSQTRVRLARQDGAFPVVLSGSCFAAVGVVAGLEESEPSVVWFDAHADFNEPVTSVSGYFDGMGLAVLTGSAWQGLLATVPGAAARAGVIGRPRGRPRPGPTGGDATASFPDRASHLGAPALAREARRGSRRCRAGDQRGSTSTSTSTSWMSRPPGSTSTAHPVVSTVTSLTSSSKPLCGGSPSTPSR